MHPKICVGGCFNFPIGNENGKRVPRASCKLALLTGIALQRLVQGVIDRLSTAGCWSGRLNDEGLGPDGEVRGSLSELLERIKIVSSRGARGL